MTSKKITQLTAATVAELADASVVPLVIDPSGSPTTRKSTLSALGAMPASWLDELAAGHTLGSVVLGDYSVGMKFCARRSGQTCTGVRFYWNDGASKTIRCTLWKGGVAQKTADVAVSGVGYYTGTFSAANLTRNEDWYVSIREDTGGLYAYDTTITRGPLYPLRMRDIVVIHAGLYAAGNAQPSTAVSSTGSYPCEPVVTG